MDTQKIAQAIYVVNCHAKTATQPMQLYLLKKYALMKLIHEDRAEILGLHQYSSRPTPRPRRYVLASCANYYFHIIPTKEDFHLLEVIDGITEYRNPKARMSLKTAKEIIRSYIQEGEKDISIRS